MEKAIEIFKNALELEVEAEIFYEKAAEVTDDDESRMVFLELSDMEDGHAHRILERFKNTPFGQSFDADNWLEELERVSEKNMEVKVSDLIDQGDMRAILKSAIKMEEEARDNYQRLSERFNDPDDVAYCADLANEEQKHVNSLTQLLRSIDMDPDDRPEL
ncbi:MAG: ferritin family protein [Gammaproteobacteria bacterium]|nr:ferritin family protein [Gammaproteobacteria bacterium]